jgi:hypothetical protein
LYVGWGIRKCYFKEICIGLPRRFIKQLMQVAAFLVRSEERDSHFTAAAGFAFETFADFDQRKVVAEVLAKFGEAQADGAQTRLAAAAVVVLVGDVFQCARFQSRVCSHFAEIGVEGVHDETLAPSDCGLSLYKSYSSKRTGILYGADTAIWRAVDHELIGMYALRNAVNPSLEAPGETPVSHGPASIHTYQLQRAKHLDSAATPIGVRGLRKHVAPYDPILGPSEAS